MVSSVFAVSVCAVSISTLFLEGFIFNNGICSMIRIDAEIMVPPMLIGVYWFFRISP